ncbi:DUF427 domain-containing protein [Amycolatopsis thermoflava]|uniref:Uncharacterized protein (DUF427 family) n=1 Tax=Amycolatopsis thermoflava TaxID=84480 RepID=A0A3N2GQR9_9PSEU|nr:DUF427 domain-containing protein [Amycolatopsis thermoflava]ROS38976.1 uncharacterized protein (DUF427 family) [Amycolatopsis thermoflava]
MALQLSLRQARELPELRFEPTRKRVRAVAGGKVFADSRRAALVWEPRRVVPQYAFPAADVLASLTPAPPSDVERHPVSLGPNTGVLDPSTGFAAHTTAGTPLTLSMDGVVLEGAGFRPDDPDLAEYVIADFDAFDEWLEEDETIVSHPRDPFHRVDVRRSSRHVRVEVDGVPLADTKSPLLVFETSLPPRLYLPPSDVDFSRLRESARETTCAYKGRARYWSAEVGGRTHPDLAWAYENPLPDAVQLAGHVAFFDERVDVTLDGERVPRPVTPWS